MADEEPTVENVDGETCEKALRSSEAGQERQAVGTDCNTVAIEKRILRSLSRLASVWVWLLLAASWPCFAETVEVKFRGPVDLSSFQCNNVAGGAVKRVCYDPANFYMLMDLNGTWHQYCEMDAKTVLALLSAPSKEMFFDKKIKNSETGDKFSCRNKAVPGY